MALFSSQFAGNQIEDKCDNSDAGSTATPFFPPAFLYLVFPAYCSSNPVCVISWLMITFSHDGKCQVK